MMTKDQIEQATRWLDQYWNALQEHFSTKMQKPTLHWDLKGRTAGRAWRTRIAINPEVWLHGEEEIQKTIGHELAHSACSQKYRDIGIHIKSHGKEWKSAMTAIGLTTERCHHMPLTPARSLNRVRYECACGCNHNITERAHRKIQMGASYYCTRCKGFLTRNADAVPIKNIQKKDQYSLLVGTEKYIWEMMQEGRTDEYMLEHLKNTRWGHHTNEWCLNRLRVYKQVVNRKVRL